VLLAEDAEEYELEILGPDDDVRRTVTALTSPAFTYTTAMQAEDFPQGYPASAILVYQINAQVGRGFAARLDFPDAPQLTTLGESIGEGQAASLRSPPTRVRRTQESVMSAPMDDFSPCRWRGSSRRRSVNHIDGADIGRRAGL
jgi:hypothetical protein